MEISPDVGAGGLRCLTRCHHTRAAGYSRRQIGDVSRTKWRQCTDVVASRTRGDCNEASPNARGAPSAVYADRWAGRSRRGSTVHWAIWLALLRRSLARFPPRIADVARAELDRRRLTRDAGD